MVTCFVGLGANLGNRKKNLQRALKFLRQEPAIKIRKVSSIIESAPASGPAQPKFLNAVAKIETSYSAQKLLEKLQEIEEKLGRKRKRLKNEPRSIDLDILLYGDEKIDEKNLKVPHPRMWERKFVMAPLKEIAPEIVKIKQSFLVPGTAL